MAEHWITASQALEIAGDRLSLCARLHAGLIKAGAKTLTTDGKESHNVIVPKEFWWAEGHDALEQDWATGDFSTWIDHKYRISAFGVSFALSGLLEMVPYESRASIARNLSVAGSPDWIPALAARRFVYDVGGHNPAVAGAVLIEHARLGFVVARAVLARGSFGGSEKDWNWQEREWNIPTWFWTGFTSQGQSTQDWNLGLFAGRGAAPDKTRWITLTGVHFLVSSMEVFRPKRLESPEEIALKDKGGRPAEYDWLETTNAIWARIYNNELKVKYQADIERAMVEHLKKGDDEPSTSTVRPFAKKIWEKFKQD